MIRNRKYVIRYHCKTVLLGLLFASASIWDLSGQDSLTLGVHPFLPHEELYARFEPLTNYLSTELNIPVILRVGNSYDEHIAMTGREMVDISYLGPMGYIVVTEDYGLKPLVGILETNNTKHFQGVIICRRDAGISTLPELGGGRFAFVDVKSTMGYFVPLYQLFEAGLAEATLNQADKSVKILKKINDSATGIRNIQDSDFDQVRMMYTNLISNGLIQ